MTGGWILLALFAVLLLSAAFLYWLVFAPLNERNEELDERIARLDERIENEYRYRENIARAYIQGSNQRAAEREAGD